MNGILLVDKPSGMTSHDVVDRIRKVSGIRKVGHTGTLDPSATGLLILCLGKATRLSEYLTGQNKVYDGTMRFGIETTSHDLDGEMLGSAVVPPMSITDIQTYCDKFIGETEQIPPMVSAVKVGGKRLYKLARQGETVERPPRKIHIEDFKVLEYVEPDAKVLIHCGSGTYVRTLCHDIGNLAGCGAVLASLRRIQVGNFNVNDAQILDKLQEKSDITTNLLDMGKALTLPTVVLRDESKPILSAGNLIKNKDLLVSCIEISGLIQIKDKSDHLLALAQITGNAAGVQIKPKRVFI